MVHVRAAVRVGGRRWNLRLAGGIDVQLPEQDPSSAWLRLAQYQRSHSVLSRDVTVVDLRLPDRLIVRKSPQRETITLNLGQET
jgi:cell division protein FtsQ